MRLAARAREGALTLADVEGGTFSAAEFLAAARTRLEAPLPPGA